MWKSARQLWIEQGEEKGLAEGLRQGRQEGLLRLIELKFGRDAAEANRARIEQADADTLLIWSERILAAEQVDGIFQ